MAGLYVRAVVDTSRLDQIVDKLPEAAAMVAEAAAEAVAKKAQSYAPVRTGALRASIQKVGSGIHWMVTALVAYAAFVEWGTRYMAARPYMRPAMESGVDDSVIDAFFRAIGL